MLQRGGQRHVFEQVTTGTEEPSDSGASQEVGTFVQSDNEVHRSIIGQDGKIRNA